MRIAGGAVASGVGESDERIKVNLINLGGYLVDTVFPMDGMRWATAYSDKLYCKLNLDFPYRISSTVSTIVCCHAGIILINATHSSPHCHWPHGYVLRCTVHTLHAAANPRRITHHPPPITHHPSPPATLASRVADRLSHTSRYTRPVSLLTGIRHTPSYSLIFPHPTHAQARQNNRGE